MWIDLDGSKFNITNAFALKPVGDGDEQCTLFSTGASPVDGGHLIDLPLDECFALIQSARLVELSQMLDADADANTEAESAYRTPNTEAASPVSSADERDD